MHVVPGAGQTDDQVMPQLSARELARRARRRGSAGDAARAEQARRAKLANQRDGKEDDRG